MKENFVAVMVGSDSDLNVMQSTLDTLDSLDVQWEITHTVGTSNTRSRARLYPGCRCPRMCCIYCSGRFGSASRRGGCGQYAQTSDWCSA